MSKENSTVIALVIITAIAIGWAPVIWFDFARWTEMGDWFTRDLLTNSEILRNLSFPIGGFVAVGIAVWRARAADKQNGIANAANVREIGKIDQERYQTGAVGLGATSQTVRIAAMTTLTRLAVEPNSAFRMEIHLLLYAFLSELSRQARESDANAPPDLVACFNALVTIKRAGHELPLILDSIWFKGANLRDYTINDIRFTGCNFDQTELSHSTLKKCVFHICSFTEARALDSTWHFCKFKNTSLKQTYLKYADFKYCDFDTINAAGANFEVSTFEDTQINSFDLSDAGLEGMTFKNASIGPSLRCWADNRPSGVTGTLIELFTCYAPPLDEAQIASTGLAYALKMKRGSVNKHYELEPLDWADAVNRYPDEGIPF